ncbi:MAG: DUF58 domain-containing protein [Planctomycetota bacterium]
MAYVLVTAFVAVGAINSQNNLLFWALGLGIGGLMASGFVSGTSLMGVTIERDDVGEVVAGQPFALRYRIHNHNRFVPAYALLIEELPPKNGGDSWPLAGAPVASLSRIPPRRTARTETLALVHRRGPFEMARVRVSTTFPFGVARKSVTFDLPQPSLASPAMARLRQDFLEAAIAPTQDGTELIAAPGAGEDLYGVREYRAGDRVRDIAWRLSARTDTLVVQQRCARLPRRLVIQLDLPQELAARREDDAERLLALAASIIAEAGRRAVAVGLVVPAAGIATGSVTTAAGRRGLLRRLGSYGFADREGDALRPLRSGQGSVVLALGPGSGAGGGEHAVHLGPGDLLRLAADSRAVDHLRLLFPEPGDNAAEPAPEPAAPAARTGQRP